MPLSEIDTNLMTVHRALPSFLDVGLAHFIDAKKSPFLFLPHQKIAGCTEKR